MVDLTTAPQVDAGATPVATTADLEALQAFVQKVNTSPTPPTLMRLPISLLLDSAGGGGTVGGIGIFATIAEGEAATSTGDEFYAPDADGDSLYLRTRTAGGSALSGSAGIATRDDIAPVTLRRNIGMSPPQALGGVLKIAQLAAQGQTARLRVLMHGDSVGLTMYDTFIYNLHLAIGGTTNLLPNDGVGDVSANLHATAADPIDLASVTGGTTEARFDLWPGMTVLNFSGAATITPLPQRDWVRLYLRKFVGGPIVDLKIGGTVVASVDCNGSEGIAILNYSTPGTRFAAAVTMEPRSGTATLYVGTFEETTQAGLSILSVGQSGFLLSDQMQHAQARANYAAFIADWAPGLITFSMEDEDTALFETAFGQLLDLFDANAPLATKLYAEPDSFTPEAISAMEGQIRRMVRVLETRDTMHQFIPRVLAAGDRDLYDALGAYLSGDKIHATTFGRVMAMAPFIAEKGMGLLPWFKSPNAVNAPMVTSRFAVGSKFGTGLLNSFGPFVTEMTVFTEELETGFGFDVPRYFAARRREDNQIMFRVGRPNNAVPYLTEFAPNGRIALDGTRTILETNQTYCGIKGVRFRDEEDTNVSGADEANNKAAPIQAIMVPATFTVATAPAANLTQSVIIRLSDGPQGDGLYISKGANWLRIFGGRQISTSVTVPTLAAGAWSSVQAITALAGVAAAHVASGNLRYLDAAGDDIIMHIIATHAGQIRVRFQNVGAASVPGASRTANFVVLEP
jgi:hypothetical protein